MTLTSRRPSRQRIATHEAGHVVAALIAGATVRRASIETRDGLLGHVSHGSVASDDWTAFIVAAGPAAELEAFGDFDPRLAAQDLSQLRAFSRLLFPGKPEAGTTGFMVASARRLLRGRWSAVIGFREELVAVGTLEGPAIARIAQRVGLSAKRPRPRKLVWDRPERGSVDPTWLGAPGLGLPAIMAVRA